jgi:hypothetical protein
VIIVFPLKNGWKARKIKEKRFRRGDKVLSKVSGKASKLSVCRELEIEKDLALCDFII